MKVSFLIFSTVLSFPAAALAAVCVENNTMKCDALGYTESSCKYGGIACPFDTSRWSCTQWTCEDGRYLSSPRTDVECIAVTYKDMTCYDCERKCTDGTYETYEACMTNMPTTSPGTTTPVTTAPSLTGRAVTTAVSSPAGTAASSTDVPTSTTDTTGPSTSDTTDTPSDTPSETLPYTCIQNSNGCWERQEQTTVPCPVGYFGTEEACQEHLSSEPTSTSEAKTCVADDTGCWYVSTTCINGSYNSEAECLAAITSTSQTCIQNGNCWHILSSSVPEPNPCSDGYAREARLCGQTGEEGWHLDTKQPDPDASAEGCYKCEENDFVVSEHPDVAVSPTCDDIFPAASVYVGAMGNVRYYRMDCEGYGYIYNCDNVGGCCQHASTYNGKACKATSWITVEPQINFCCQENSENWYKNGTWGDAITDDNCIRRNSFDPYYSPGLNSGFIYCRRAGF